MQILFNLMFSQYSEKQTETIKFIKKASRQTLKSVGKFSIMLLFNGKARKLNVILICDLIPS